MIYKFRKYDNIRKEMIYFNFEDLCECQGIYNNCIKFDFKDVMQYTGRKDKNDKEIFEGDVMITNGEIKFLIVFEKEAFCTKFYSIGFKKVYTKSLFDDPKKYTIIGNRYENPELLKDIE